MSLSGDDLLSQESPKQKPGMTGDQPETILSLSFSTGLTNASQQLHHLFRTLHSDVSSENTNMYVLVYRLYLFLAVVLLTCVSPHFSIK